jgi:hypothetical protein
MAGLGNLADSYCNSMKCFRRVGSGNPLNFFSCRIPSTGTTSAFAVVRICSLENGFT